jgi:hypothetical protein
VTQKLAFEWWIGFKGLLFRIQSLHMNPSLQPTTVGNMATPEQMELFYTTVFQVDDVELVIAMFQQDLNTIENINLLTVDDITRVRNNIRRPGGMVQDEDGDINDR